MTYIILTVVWSCPGVFGLTFVPKALQPVVCIRDDRVEAVPDYEAMRYVDKMGPQSGAKVYQFVQEGRLKEVPIKWAAVWPEGTK